MTKITNTTKAVLGINAKVGGKVQSVSLAPGETKDLDVIKTKVHEARIKSGALKAGGGSAPAKKDDNQPKSAAEVLALAEGNFMTFKAAATKVLGDDTPATKDEIVAALKTKAEA